MNEQQETIISSAILLESGEVICGVRHHNCFDKIVEKFGEKQRGIKWEEEEQGFWTNRARFVSREEGAQIAYKAGQIKWDEIKRRGARMSSDGLHPATLYSEDLW